jgi:predicted Zn-dependent peptidase
MVFKGTQKRSIKDIAQSLESVGGYLNAFTGKEHTCYYARALDEHLGLAMDVLADLLLGATFPADELEKEKSVVIEELRNAEDDPDDLIHDIMEKEVFRQHSLGRTVIGTEKNIRAFKRSDLIAFRARRYTPSNVVVAVAGHLQHDDVVAEVQRLLGGMKDGSAESQRPKPKAPQQSNVRLKKPIQQAHLCAGTLSYSVHRQERFPLLVMNTLLGDGMSSRLFQSVRERRGIAYSVYSYANPMTDTGTFGVYAGLDRANIDRTLDLVWKELDSLRRKAVPLTELRRTKDQLKGSMMLSLESIPNRMMRLGGSELSLGKLPSLDTVLESIDAVTQDDVLRIANDILQPERFSTVILEPDGSADRKG